MTNTERMTKPEARIHFRRTLRGHVCCSLLMVAVGVLVFGCGAESKQDPQAFTHSLRQKDVQVTLLGNSSLVTWTHRPSFRVQKCPNELNSEMTNAKSIIKAEVATRHPSLSVAPVIRHSSFGFLSGFAIRHSDFPIGISDI